MEPLFDIILAGKLDTVADVEAVKRKLAALLKTDEDNISRLLAAAPVVIRKGVGRSAADKYQRALENAGAVCNIEPAAHSQKSEGQPAGDIPSPQPDENHSHVQVVSHAYKGGDMIITNIESVPGKTIVEHFGLVSGSTIRAKHVGRDIMASLKNLVGGELKGYTQLLRESRRQAMDRMVEQARQLGANAIVNVRFSTSSVSQGAAELYAYGTAVRVKD